MYEPIKQLLQRLIKRGKRLPDTPVPPVTLSPRALAAKALERMPENDPDRMLLDMWLRREKIDYIALKCNCSKTTLYNRKEKAVKMWANTE